MLLLINLEVIIQMSKIGCTVSNCKYWESNLCTANEIQVNMNEHVTGSTDMEIGMIGGTGGGTAKTSPETQCTTFIPRG